VWRDLPRVRRDGLYGLRDHRTLPHRANRTRPNTQDGRPLRRDKRRWKVERLFAWLQNFRRVLVRHDYHVENFLGFVHLGCIMILLRWYL
jgi:transposase